MRSQNATNRKVTFTKVIILLQALLLLLKPVEWQKKSRKKKTQTPSQLQQVSVNCAQGRIATSSLFANSVSKMRNASKRFLFSIDSFAKEQLSNGMEYRV